MIEQLALTLFETKEQNVAETVLKDLNALKTIWHDSFYIDEIDLCKWEHITDEEKVLTVIYRSRNNEEYAAENNFIYFGTNTVSMRELNMIYDKSELLNKHRNDKDLAVSITPTMIFLYWHKFERKHI